jgi:hypothetical protein
MKSTRPGVFGCVPAVDQARGPSRNGAPDRMIEGPEPCATLRSSRGVACRSAGGS